MKYKLSTNQLPKTVSVQLDGSKSISNRLLILQQVSLHDFSLTNVSNSDDSILMQRVLSEYKTNDSLYVANAGTVTRFLTAFLCTQNGRWQLHCAEPMKKRPIKLLVDVLRELGAKIEYLENEGFLPLSIEGSSLASKIISIDAGVSSQYISALMMIAPLLEKGLTIQLEGEIASKPYLEITVNTMRQCGFAINFEGNTIEVKPGQEPIQKPALFVESDWSAAAFYYTIALLQQFEEIELSGLLPAKDSSQGDSIATEFYKKLGVATSYTATKNVCLSYNKATKTEKELEFNFLDQPDMVPAFAVACGFLGVRAKFSGVRNLIIKESNRLVAMQTELKKMGVQFTAVNEDVWRIEGKIDTSTFSTIEINTYHDHRIAMAFGCLGFIENGLTINDPMVVTKSYPDFWEDMKSLGLEIEKIDY